MSRDNLKYDSPVFTLVSYLFREYLVERDLTTEDAQQVSMRDFYTWFKERSLPLEDRYQLQETYGIADEEFEDFEDTMADPFSFVAVMYPAWPMLVYGLKSQPESRPLSVSVTVQLDWGTRAIAFPAMAEIPSTVPVDGFIVAAIRRMVMDMSGVFIASGGVAGFERIRTESDSNTFLRALDQVFGDNVFIADEFGQDDLDDYDDDVYGEYDDDDELLDEEDEEDDDDDVEQGFAIYFDKLAFIGDFEDGEESHDSDDDDEGLVEDEED